MYYDQLGWVGDAVNPETGFTLVNEYYDALVQAYLRVAAKDSFGFIYCGWKQQLPLIERLEEQEDIKATPCYVERKPFPNQIRRENTAYPINAVEVAIHIKRGNPKWAQYGNIKLIIGIHPKTKKPRAYIPNLFKVQWPSANPKHPFNKPPELYKSLISMFSRPEHQVLEAFAGTCTSVQGCMELGRNLDLVEKDPAQRTLFLERIEQVKEMLGGEETQAEKLAALAVQGTSKETSRPFKTPEFVPESEEEEEEEANPLLDIEAEEVEESESEPAEEEVLVEEEESEVETGTPKSDDSEDEDYDPEKVKETSEPVEPVEPVHPPKEPQVEPPRVSSPPRSSVTKPSKKRHGEENPPTTKKLIKIRDLRRK